MKLIPFDSLQAGAISIKDISNAGFDLLITTSNDEILRVEDGLTDLVTKRAKLSLANGNEIDYKSLIEKIIADEGSLKTLDINFVGDSDKSVAADKDGTGVKEGKLDKVSIAFKEVLNGKEQSVFEEDMTPEEFKAALAKALEEAKAAKAAKEAAEAELKAAEEAAKDLEEEDLNEDASETDEDREQADESKKHVEQMQNELRVEKVEKNENTSKQTGDYDLPPLPTNNNSGSGSYNTEGEPEEEETYEFKVSLKSDSDSGAKGDFITNVGEPVFTGTGTPTTIVTITINGTDYSTTVDGEGNWVMPPIPKLEEGEHKYSAKDSAGNKVSGTIVIDQTNTLTHDLQNDTGESDSDNITQDSRLVYVGKTDAGSEVILKINGKEYKSTANADGDYTIKMNDTLPDGVFDYEIASTDVAGNIVTQSGKVTVDTKIEAVVGLSKDQDTGLSDSDEITKNNQNLTIMGNIETGATAFLHFNGIKYPVQIQSDGTWSITIPDHLNDGTYPYKLEVTDVAGNHEVINGSIVVDTETYLSGGLDSKSDTGESNTDGFTSDNTPTFSGDGEPKSRVILEINGREYSTYVGADGTWQIDVVDALPEGNHDYTITLTDVAGNEKYLDGNITVDTGVKVEATLETDSGSSNSDGITNIKNNVISGKTEVGAKGTILITGLNGGQPIDLEIQPDGSFTFKTGELSDGEYSYTIQVTDRAGNKASITNKFVVDTSTFVEGGLSASSDSGTSNSDGITKNNTPSFSGTGEPNSTILLIVGGKEYTTKVDKDGRWNLTATEALSDGTYNVEIKITDIAGNTSEASDTITIDTKAPVSVTVNLDNDTGESERDWITKEGRLALNGTVEAGCSLSITIDGRTYSTADGLIVNSDGTWSFSMNSALTDGTYDIEILATDIAGNQMVIEQQVVVDTKTHIEGGLSTGSDTGGSSNDGITNNNKPSIEGIAEANSKIVVTINGVDYATTSDEFGRWRVNVNQLNDGTYDVVMVVTDLAGNTAKATDTITIDTIDPIESTIQLKNDTGESARDFITKDNIPALQGVAEPNTSVQIVITFENGEEYRYSEPDVALDSVTGEWSFTSPIALPDGTHTVAVISTDKAGNNSTKEQSITVDTAIDLTATLDPMTDSGSSNTDGITKNTMPSFKGTGTTGDSITIIINGNSYSTVVGDDGTWNIRVTDALAHRPDQPYEYQVTAIDTAGNSITKNGSITIDTDTVVAGGLDSTSDTGVIDRITSDNTPLFSGTGEIGAEIVLVIDGKTYEAIVNDKGRWSIQVQNPMPDATYSYTITSTDKAGNVDTVESDVTIDTKTSVSGGLDASSDSAESDSITKFNRPYFSGKGEVGATITVSINGKEYSTVADLDGNWKVQVSDVLSDDTYSFKIVAVDIAGNKAELPEGQVTIDTKTYVTGGLAAGYDTGANTTDKITNIESPVFAGTGEVGGTVTITIDNREYSALVGNNGRWTINNISSLSDGLHNYEIKIVDVAGNVATFEDHIIVDTTPPEFNPAQLENDSGLSNTDMITKNGNLVFVGKVESSDVNIQLSINGKVYRSPDNITVMPNGEWRFELPETLVENSNGYNFTITYTDAAGNPAVQSGKVIVDTSNSITGGLDSDSDSGIIGDKLTKNTKPSFSGKSEPNSSITLFIDGNEYTAKTDRDGNWFVTTGHNLVDGTYEYTIVSVDTAGNRAELSESVTIDTKPASLSNITLENDSNIDGDWITKNAAPEWSGKLEGGAELIITIIGNGTNIVLRSPDDFTVDSEGNWSATLGEDLGDGSYTVKFDAKDAAGNESSISHNLVVDTTISVTGSMDSSTDTGSSDSDLITSNRTPLFTGKGEIGAEVTLLINGKKYTTVVDANGNWSVALDTQLPDNTYSVEISIKDLAGNEDHVPAFNVTIDGTAPTINKIELASDSGEDKTDGLTNVKNPVFEGKTEVGSKVELNINNINYTINPSSIDADGNWSFTVPDELSDGTYQWSLLVTDVAGNSTTRKGEIEIDTKNSVTGGLSAESDSGSSNSDGLTYERQPKFNGKTDPLSEVTLILSNGSEYTAKADDNGNWAIDVTETLADGKYSYEIISVDPAGNESNTLGSFEVDGTEPPVTIKLVNDTGTSDSDGITKSRTPVFSGTSEAGATIEITVNGITYGEPAVKVNADGSWTFVSPIELADGTYQIAVKAIDLAGNESESSTTIVIDNTVFVSGGLKTTSDSGADNNDGITNATNPEFEGRGEAGSKITFKVGGFIYTTIVGDDELWEIAITDLLPEGTHPLEITVEDKAGNSKTIHDEITIDRTSELTARLDASSDSGVSNSDKITNQKQPLFSGKAEEGSTITLTINGVSKEIVVDSSGDWQIQWDAELPEGRINVEVVAVDIAGNRTVANEIITIDTTKPAIPMVSIDNDTGLDDSDSITKNNRPQFSGTIEAGAKVIFVIDGRSYSSPDDIEVASNGDWVFRVPVNLDDGDHEYTVIVEDKAGNQSEFDGVVKIDTQFSMTVALDDESDSGVKGDNITNDTTPTFAGIAEEGALIKITINGFTYETTALAGGRWSFTIPDSLPHGTYNYVIEGMDVAGNTDEKTGTIVIDTATEIKGGLDASSNSNLTSDLITNSEVIKFSGTGEAGANISISINNKVYETSVDEYGSWSFTIPDSLGEGNFEYVIVATDAAGNTDELKDTITIDRTNFIDAGLKSASDTGLSQSDEITKDNRPTFVGSTQPNTEVKLVINSATTYNIQLNEDGTFEFRLPSELLDGTYSYKFISMDIAGNSVEHEGELVVDTKSSGTAGLDADSDSGIKGDNTTSNKTPVFSGKAEVGSKIKLTIDGKEYNATANEKGEWSITIPSEDELTDGEYDYEAVIVDVAGNEKTISDTVTIDTKTQVTAHMTSDTGESDSDGITQAKTPTFTGTLEVGSSITITIGTHTYTEADGIIVNANGTWSFTVPAAGALNDGTYEWKVQTIDVAGNVGVETGNITVDTTKPSELTIELLNGSVSDTSISKNPIPSFGGQSEAGTKIKIMVNGKEQSSSSITVDENGNWQYTSPVKLDDGDYVFEVISVDAAGNQEVITHNLTIDTSTHLSGGLDASSDTGDSNADGITKNDLLTFSGEGEADATIVITIDGKDYDTIVDENGQWSLTLDNKLYDGVYDYTITATDRAGNPATTEGQVTVDSFNKLTAEMKDTSDTGHSHYDNITNDKQPVFVGTTEVGSRVKLLLNDETEFAIDVNADGRFEFMFPEALDDGDYTFTFISVDVAGNEKQVKGEFTIDTSTSLTGGLDNDSDSGIVGDNITKHSLPTFSGQAEPNAKIILRINNVDHEMYAEDDGSWSLTLAEQYRLTDGTYSYTIETIDVAGNRDDVEGSITIDTHTSVTAIMTSDTGDSSTDGVTQSQCLSWTGTLEKGSTISVTIGNRTYTEANGVQINSDGTWSLTMPDSHALEDGTYNWHVEVRDPAGNPASESGTVTVDTAKPTELTVQLQNGTVADTSITGNPIPTFGGSSEAGSKIVVMVDGVTQSSSLINVNPDGTWSFTASSKMEDGTYEFKVISEDAAGNQQEITKNVEIDTSTKVTGRLAATSDAGVSNSDGVTNSKEIVFEGTGEVGAEITLTINGVEYDTVVGDDGEWQIIVGELDGSNNNRYPYTIEAVDKAGNRDKVNGTIEVDTVDPLRPNFTLDAESDSSNKGDWITKSENISISGVGEAGSKIKLTINGVHHYFDVDSTGQWNFDFGALEEGSHTVTVVASDKAGNTSISSETIVVDRSITLTGGLTSTADNDTGESTTDDYTANKKPEFSGTSDPLAKITVTIVVAGGANIVLETVADENGNWVISSDLYPSELKDGTYEYTIKAEDAAGNTADINESFVVDNTISVSIMLSSSTNSNDLSDTVTNYEKPRFEGVGQANDKITVVILDSRGAEVSVLEATVGASGKWMATVETALRDGDYTVQVTSVDKAGNRATDDMTITIDTTPPSLLNGGLDNASNSGDKDDTITQDNTPMFSGRVEVGCTVQLVFSNGNTYDAIVDPQGNWSLSINEVIPDGFYTYEIIAEDVAGNKTTVDRDITIDRTIAFEGGLAEGHDTGEFDNDWITKNDRPDYVGKTDAFSKVQITLNTNPPKTIEVTADADGNFSANLGDLFGAGGTIPDGVHSISVLATDPAGNKSSHDHTLTVDTQKPTGLTVEMDETSDSGAKGDFITNDNTPVLKGRVEIDGVKLKIHINNKFYPVTINDDGTWSFSVPRLDDGTYPFRVIAQDTAGNQTVISKDLVIDTKEPENVTGRLSASSDEGSSNSDHITSTNTNLRFEGTTEAGTTIELIIDGVSYEAAVGSDGRWSVIVPTRFNDGDYTAHIVATDKAGNINDDHNINFTIDTVDPVLSQIKLRPSDDSGEVGDNITNVKQPTIVGNVSLDAARVWITIDGTSKLFEGTIDENGRWNVRLSGLSDGTYTYTVHAMDVAGNETSFSGNNITIDTANNVDAWLSSESDSGSSNSDGITNERNPVIKGTTDAGNTLTIEVRDSNGTVVYTDSMLAEGNEFQFEIKTKLKHGDYTWEIVSTDTAGNKEPVDGEFTIDLVSTVTAGLHSASDTGIVGDNMTNNQNPLLSGKAEPHSKIKIEVFGSFNGTTLTKTYNVEADAQGNWSCTVADNVIDGRYTYKVTAVDVAGNTSDPANGEFIVDRSPPTVTGNIKTDSGSSASDSITNGVADGDKKGHLDFAGSTGGDAVKVVLMIGGRTYVITPKPDGSWDFVVPDRLPDNRYSYTIYSEDAAGNKSPNVVGEVVLDTRISTTPNLSQSSDTGEQGDHLTNNKKPIISGVGEADLQLSASIVVGGNTISLGSTTSNGKGEWSLNIGNFVSAGLPDGAYTITFNATDKAGNNGSFTYRFTVDTTPPTVTLNKYNASEVTTDKPRISGSGESGSTVVLTVEGETYSTVVGSNGQWAFASAEMPSFPDGEVNYTVYAVDKAGNRSETITDTITINTGTYVDGGLDENTDTGALNTDGITQNRTPTFKGSGEAGGDITITIRDANGNVIRTYETVVERNGTWTIHVPSNAPLPDGKYTYVIGIEDSTGNTAFVDEKDLQIDNSLVVEEIRAWEGSWGGSLQNGVWYLGQRTNYIRGKLANNDKGAEIKVTINGTEYVGVSDKNGNFSILLNLPDGMHTAQISITDAAGNHTSTSMKIHVDTTANVTFGNDDDVTGHQNNWVVSTSRPSFSGDADPTTGQRVRLELFGETNLAFEGSVANGQWVLNPNSDIPDGTYSYRIIYWEKSGRWAEQRGTIIVDTVNEVLSINDVERVQDANGTWTKSVISGFGEPNANIELTLNGVKYTAKVSSGGQWSIQIPITANGIYEIHILSTDRAGNEKELIDNNFVVDFIDNLEVDLADGTIFNPEGNPLTGTGDAGSSLRIKIIDADGKEIIRYAAVNSDGTWFIDLSDLADGNYTVVITATSNWGEKEVTTTIGIDKTPPAIISVELDTDTGVDGDNITYVKNPTFSGQVEAGTHKVTITIGGITYESGSDFVLNADGSWTFTVPVDLTDGNYSYTVTATDKVGNSTDVSGNVTIQATPPTITNLAIEDGKLVDGTLITNNEHPELSGTASSGTTALTITIGDVTLVSGTDFFILPNGNWEIRLPADLAEGSHTIKITAVNAAGVESEQEIEFVIDKTAPEGTGSLDTSANDFGEDGYISNSRPVFSGTGEAGAVVQVKIDGKTYSSKVSPDGLWEITIPTDLNDGKYLYVLEITDIAGNTTEIDYDMFYIDTVDPVINSVSFDSDIGVDGDGVTSIKNPSFSGQVNEDTSKVTFTIGDAIYESGRDFVLKNDGTWSFTLPVELSDGVHNYTVTAFDKAGNNVSHRDSITIDTQESVQSNVVVDGGVDVNGQIVTPTENPTLTGQADGNILTVTLAVGGETLVSGEDFFLLPNGSWTANLPEGLGEGVHTVTITSESNSGFITEQEFKFEIDLTPPTGAAELDHNANTIVGENTISNSQPTFSGTGDVGSVVTLTIGSESYPVQITETGEWTITVPEALNDESYAYSIIIEDAVGNEATLDVGMIVIDSTAGAGENMEVKPEVYSLPTESVDSDSQTLQGEAEFGEIITLAITGTDIQVDAVADFDGSWEIAIPETLESGIYQYSVRKIDINGDESTVQEGTLSVGKETESLSTPQIEVTQTNDELIVSGFADANSEVVIVAGDSELRVLTNDFGEWTAQVNGSENNIEIHMVESGKSVIETIDSTNTMNNDDSTTHLASINNQYEPNLNTDENIF